MKREQGSSPHVSLRSSAKLRSEIGARPFRDLITTISEEAMRSTLLAVAAVSAELCKL